METATGENMYLINSNNKHHWCWKLKNRYSHTVVTSKLAILCLVWLGILIDLFLPGMLAIASFSSELLSLGLCVVWLMNPVFGYLGERWNRYYVIMSGVLITCCASLLMQFVLVLEKFNLNGALPFWLVCGSFMIRAIGEGIFISNIVQFSITQIGYASSSQQLASFARWWVFTNFLYVGIENTFQIFSPGNCQILDYIVIVISFFFTVGCLMIGVCFKSKFVIEPPPNIDPLKLVYQVVKYAWKHKYPERRSAFTYSDDTPSRLDFGKNRYGGPFTTDQVESVKSFGNVLAVLLSSTLFSYYIVADPAVVENASSNATVFTAELWRYYTNTNFITIVLMIPLLQLIVVPFFPYLIPTILKRIWFGLLLKFVSFSTAAICYPLISSKATFSSIVLGISVVNDVGSALIIFSSLEFILAQAPCQMQGLLIGVWSSKFGAGSIISFISEKAIVMFYYLPTGLLLLSLVVYSIVMYYYKYRLRNEPSNINVRKRVEEVYERNFERKDLANNDEDVFVSSLIHCGVSNQT